MQLRFVTCCGGETTVDPRAPGTTLRYRSSHGTTQNRTEELQSPESADTPKNNKNKTKMVVQTLIVNPQSQPIQLLEVV